MTRARKGATGARQELEALPRTVLNALRKHGTVRAGERVGVAVSGGADSVALLLLLEELRDRLGIVLSVVHFNHKLRGRAADADEKFVSKMAAARGLIFHVDRANVAVEAKKARANVEETARRLRYQFFERLVRDGRVDRVAVAHTADDQAETVLAHILRGTGMAGLGGIHPAAGAVIRPLLGVRRAELRAFLKARRQKWREDATNLDETRLRARIRRRLLPLLEKQFQPATVVHLAKLAELAREDEAVLDALVEERFARLVERKEGGAKIRVADLLEPWGAGDFTAKCMEKKEGFVALSKRLVRRIVKQLKSRTGQISSGHVEAVLELARQGQSGKRLILPGDVEVRRELDALSFLSAACDTAERKTQPSRGGSRNNSGLTSVYEYEVMLGSGGAVVRVPWLGCAFRLRVIDWPREARETKLEGVALDRDRLRSPLVLRNWRPGDAYRPAGHSRPHKLKRMFLEKRVSRWERESWPVLTSGGSIVWARGFPVAAEYAPTAQTQAGLLIAEVRD